MKSDNELTADRILAEVTDPAEVLAGHAAALAEVEQLAQALKAATDAHAAALVRRHIQAIQQSSRKAQEVLARCQAASARLSAWGEALDRLGAVVEFLRIIESN